MKFLFSVLAFLLALTLTYQTLASSPTAPHGSEKGAVSSEGHSMGFHQPQTDKERSTPPKATSNLEPAFDSLVSAGQVTLKWGAVDTADSYHLQVATDPNFKWLKVNEPLLAATSFDVKELEAGKSYYWRVAAVRTTNMPGTSKSSFVKSSFQVK